MTYSFLILLGRYCLGKPSKTLHKFEAENIGAIQIEVIWRSCHGGKCLGLLQ